MDRSGQFLGPAETARLFGVSAKALRLYEDRGLVTPVRTEAGWRTYGPDEQARVGEIAALRALGLSLQQISAVLAGDCACLDRVLEAHHGNLEQDLADVSGQIQAVSSLRACLEKGEALPLAELTGLAPAPAAPVKILQLPWPWGGERFELSPLAPVTFLTGPLGSGKTRLAKLIAGAFAGGVFLELDRQAGLRDADHEERVRLAVEWIEGEGGEDSGPLRALLAWVEEPSASPLVVDLVEHGLTEATQTATMAYLRTRASADRPLVLMTRSTVILDLENGRPGEPVIYCPANHSPPVMVSPFPGTPGYEAVAMCLAAPDVRARTADVVVMRASAGA